MSDEFRNEDTGPGEPPPPIRPKVPPPLHWGLKLLFGIGIVVGVGVIGIVVLAGLVLATCALGGR